MTRDDIYDHLAQVYLGKRNKIEEKKKKEFNAWLLINIFITIIIFISAFYGLTAFFTRQGTFLKNNIIFSLHNGPVRIEYNFQKSLLPVQSLDLSLLEVDVTKYNKIHFSIRAKEEGSPGVIKVVLKNKREEKGVFYAKGISLGWKEFEIPFEEFKEITDWSSLKNLSFEVESWNADKSKGIVLINDIYFSG